MGEVVENGGAEIAEKPVMVAVDESECSHYALMWVIDNLKESITAQKPLLIFMAQPPPANNLTFAAALGSARMYCPPTTEFTNNMQENHRKLTTALLERAKDICASHGVTAKTVTEIGDAKTAICAAVLKHNVSMLVLGARGLGKIKRAIIGSVSNYCVQHAKCPVLVVKKPQVV
ncbi:universal stress protein A-like protein [Argentina anserina]|uniref:universal stress protein A-like protein n=1 Tax=Argentina anserina TaxID=57926 RepID=UPI0021768FD6|nr:universal stress protein A-like protein [Potentilla anserina]